MTFELPYLPTFHRFIFILQKGKGSLFPQQKHLTEAKKMVLEDNTGDSQAVMWGGKKRKGKNSLCGLFHYFKKKI